MADHDPLSWDGLAPMPVRVLVKGASSTVWVAPPGGSRVCQPFPWWLEVILTSAGLPAKVRNVAQEAQKITEALCDWDSETQRWSPDVVVLNYGVSECLPGLLPRWLQRLATGWHRHPGPLRERVRRWVITPTWRRLASLQARIDARLEPGPYRVKPRRTLAELGKLVDQIKIVGNPLILIMDPWPPAARWRSWFPGLETRATELRELLHAWVSQRADPDVRLFRLAELVGNHDLEVALPDGVHFSAPLHREIAEALAIPILEWARNQPHLQWPEAQSSGSTE